MLDLILSWLVIGIIINTIIITLITRGGTRPFGFKIRTVFISIIIWPLMLIHMTILHYRRKYTP